MSASRRESRIAPKLLAFALLLAVAIGCSQAVPAPSPAQVNVLTAADFNLSVSSETPEGARLESGVATISPNQTCVFRGQISWPDDATDLLLFEIRRPLSKGGHTTVANGEVTILKHEAGLATFEVHASIGDAERRDCEAVLYSHRLLDEHREVLAQAPIQILK